MQKTKFKIGDFFEYWGSIYKVTGIEFGSYGHIYNVEFMSGDEADKLDAFGSFREEFMTKVSYSRRPLHTPDNTDNAKDKELSAKDRSLKDLIRLVLKYHAENMAADFHTESEEEFIYRRIKANNEV